MTIFYNNIKEYCEENKLLIKELREDFCDKSHIGEDAFDSWRNHLPHVENFKAIEDYFRVNINIFLYGHTLAKVRAVFVDKTSRPNIAKFCEVMDITKENLINGLKGYNTLLVDRIDEVAKYLEIQKEYFSSTDMNESPNSLKYPESKLRGFTAYQNEDNSPVDRIFEEAEKKCNDDLSKFILNTDDFVLLKSIIVLGNTKAFKIPKAKKPAFVLPLIAFLASKARWKRVPIKSKDIKRSIDFALTNDDFLMFKIANKGIHICKLAHNQGTPLAFETIIHILGNVAKWKCFEFSKLK